MENWVLKNKKADFELIVQKCGISEVLARCLVNKGLETPEEICRFLDPGLDELHDPFLLQDMEKACIILQNKIAEGKKIRIIGDYDVDGVISTYILYRILTRLGALVDYEIPDRVKDGYGMNNQMVEDAYREQIDTLLTCDNGIVAMEQVALAKSIGMTVIVTDHHNLLEVTKENDLGDEAAAALEQEYPSPCQSEPSKAQVRMPAADAVINPKRPDDTYPYPGLCGAAIAFKLCCALMDCFDIEEKETLTQELLSYTAIATVCDVMELTGENRTIVKHGLRLLQNTHNLGLLALMDVSGIDKEQLSSFHLGFVIGPCLNASGRLDTAKKGLELLLADTKEKAAALAGEVRLLNEVRKEMTARNVEKAIQQIEESELRYDKVLVVYLPECHESIAGIIAGRVRERFNRPTLVLTDAEACVKGSGRSIEQYNMIEELSRCRDLFLKVGGHPMAAGLSLQQENIDTLRRTLNENTSLTMEMLIPKVSIDIHLPLGYITTELVNELKLLEPFGKGNEKPLFAEKDLKIKSAFIIGKNASGIRLYVENKYGREMEAVYFGDVDDFFAYIKTTYGAEEAEKLRTGRSMRATLSITYYPKINEYNGFRNLQLIIQNYR